MMKPLDISIEPIPSDTGLESGPVVLIVAAEGGATTADLYRRFGSFPVDCPAGERIVGIVSTGVLNTPDRVSATGGRRHADSFEMNLEIRHFEGSIHVNDPWIALVRIELGSLERGPYQLVVREAGLRFTELNHPERATNPATSERRINFNCS